MRVYLIKKSKLNLSTYDSNVKTKNFKGDIFTLLLRGPIDFA
jgi:hypothetical protein